MNKLSFGGTISLAELETLANMNPYGNTNNNVSSSTTLNGPMDTFESTQKKHPVIKTVSWLAGIGLALAAIRKWGITSKLSELKEVNGIWGKIKYGIAQAGEYCLKPFRFIKQIFSKQSEINETAIQDIKNSADAELSKTAETAEAKAVETATAEAKTAEKTATEVKATETPKTEEVKPTEAKTTEAPKAEDAKATENAATEAETKAADAKEQSPALDALKEVK